MSNVASVRKKIRQLERSESIAKELAMKQAMNESAWKRLYADVADTLEWDEHCKREGLRKRYTYADVLA